MPFEKGNKGRPEGSKNKLTKTVKATVLAVFNELQEDPQAKLSEWAKRETTEFYKISSKLIPTEVNATIKKLGADLEEETKFDGEIPE